MIKLFFLGLFAVLADDGLPQSPGMYEETFESSGGTLRFALSIPRNYEPDQAHPLVLALHYGGRVTPYYGRGLLTQLVEPGLRSLNAILVAPDCPSRDWNQPEVDKAVMELLQHVLESTSIDRNRILVTGYSLGGHGTWYMAARHPDFFRAAIPMAGSPDEDSLARVIEMPICIVHSVDDRVVSIGPAREAAKKLKARGANVELIVARGVDHYHFSEFIPYLRRAAKWIKKQWKD